MENRTKFNSERNTQETDERNSIAESSEGAARGNRKKSVKLFSAAPLTALLLAATLLHPMPLPEAAAEKADEVVSGGLDQIAYTANSGYKVYGDFVTVDHQGFSSFTFNQASTDKYVEAINYYAEMLPEDVNLYSMLVPTSAEWYVPAEYRDRFAQQREVMDYVWSNADSRIQKVDIYDKIAAHQDEYLYFHTDHHWTALGGYYGYTVLANELGFAPHPLSYFNLVDSGVDFVGSIGWNTGNKSLEANPDHLYYYELPNDVTYTYYSNDGYPYTSKGVYKSRWLLDKNKYAFFMGGDLAMIKLKSDVNNGKKIILIKDSYANTVVPFLTGHYEEVYLIDGRHSKYNVLDVIEQNGIQDVLILNYARVTCIPSFSRQMIELIDNDGGALPLPPAPVTTPVVTP